MKSKISPSMMCTDLMNVEEEISVLEEVGVDYLHIDIMDNHFVPNITLSTDFINAVRNKTSVPLDIHLMINNPEKTFHLYKGCNKQDIICIHYEATKHVQRTLVMIKKLGARAGIALNPGTPICMIEDLLSDIDIVLVMTVNPGFAGQKVIPSTLDKIERLRKLLDQAGYTDIEIEVDGNVSFENAKIMREKGANIFVGGTSSIFNKDASISDNCKRLKKIVGY
ncbi:ribulose-phosphate 3-epimerase [Halocella sp. SP3-1]|uniref:ribulose-phosphate 3-epimerase n=1 Tax=Halocella sp. SP3-1 TaxID=2382161 RepID=UPI000F758042|nr:ribulose-phosphate 3-epimerase [Halocella sp. SP3-1]AZO94142.1 ribulose-phosphate 3-epimerase [Halocella sp. SP3-1]